MKKSSLFKRFTALGLSTTILLGQGKLAFAGDGDGAPPQTLGTGTDVIPTTGNAADADIRAALIAGRTGTALAWKLAGLPGAAISALVGQFLPDNQL